jgi:hypothetical protein
MNTKMILPLTCAFLIAILEGIALFKGIDGKCMAVSAALIGGLGGYGVREVLQLIKK